MYKKEFFTERQKIELFEAIQYSHLTIKNPKEDSNKKLERLEKLGKLYKDGILSKEEFEAEKKKILAEN